MARCTFTVKLLFSLMGFVPVISTLMRKCNPMTPTPLSAQPAAAVPQHQTACRASERLCRRPGCCNRPRLPNATNKAVPSQQHYPMLGGYNAASPSNAAGSFVRCRCSAYEGMPMSPVLLLPWLLHPTAQRHMTSPPTLIQ